MALFIYYPGSAPIERINDFHISIKAPPSRKSVFKTFCTENVQNISKEGMFLSHVLSTPPEMAFLSVLPIKILNILYCPSCQSAALKASSVIMASSFLWSLSENRKLFLVPLYLILHYPFICPMLLVDRDIGLGFGDGHVISYKEHMPQSQAHVDSNSVSIFSLQQEF